MTKHMVQRSLTFLALTSILACTGDPTGDFANGVDHLEASPKQLFVTEGSTVSVDVTARDAANNAVQANFLANGVGPGITVVRDETFEPIRNEDGEFVPNPHPTRVRYLVTATASTGQSEFVVNAGGEATTVTVRITPTTLNVATLSAAAPALGDTVTVTAPAPYKFTPTSAVTVAGATIVKVSLAADSSSIRFLSGPSANGPISVSNAILTYSPSSGPFTLTTAATFTTPAVTNIAATFSNAAPAMNQTVTITVPAAYRLLATSSFTIGGALAPVVSRAPDGLSVVVAPAPTAAAAGPATITGVALSFLLGAPLTLPTVATIATPAPVPVAGADAFATAPTVTYPTAGSTAVLYDAGANGTVAQCNAVGGASTCRIYKFTIATATRFSFTARWAGTADLGIYWMDGTGAPGTVFCDAFGSGAGGQPETCSGTFPAGTYYFGSIQYGGAAPAWRSLTVVATAP